MHAPAETKQRQHLVLSLVREPQGFAEVRELLIRDGFRPHLPQTIDEAVKWSQSDHLNGGYPNAQTACVRNRVGDGDHHAQLVRAISQRPTELKFLTPGLAASVSPSGLNFRRGQWQYVKELY
jgi:hypothetical protein